jgi:6-methylsalicylate decarboxylase
VVSEAPVYDVHQHLWPPALLDSLRRRRRPPYLRGETLTTLEGSFRVDVRANELDRRLEALNRFGIDVAVISLQPTLGIESLPTRERAPLVSVYHEGIAELVEASAGRLRALAAGEYVAGFDGVCVGASRVHEPALLAEVLDPLQRSGGILFVHPDRVAEPPTGAPHWWAAVAEYTADMQSAYLAWVEHGAPRWPSLRVVFSLLAGGAAFQLDRLQSRGVETRRFTRAPVYLETSSYGRLSIELSLAAFGVDRIVHGSDYPVIDPDRTLEVIRGLGQAAYAAVSSRNPAALLERRAAAAKGPQEASAARSSPATTARDRDTSDLMPAASASA